MSATSHRASASSRLMAKSPDPRLPHDALTLTGHSIRVGLAARTVLRELATSLRDAFGMDDPTFRRLVRCTVVAALIHDIGKASASFQDMIAKRSSERHPWRHEMLSAISPAASKELLRWLSKALSSDELLVISMIVAGHHLRAEQNMSHPRAYRDERLLLSSPDLTPLWSEIATVLDNSTLPSLSDEELSYDYVSDLVSDYMLDGESYSRTASVSVVLPLGKAIVMAADVVGSAHAGSTTIDDWITEALSDGLRTSDLDAVISDRLGGAEPRAFQRRVADSIDRVTVVTAGCGNGKTLAAYLWARKHAIGQRLVFCYPTTGTTTAGFADYLLAQTDFERRLLHSRAQVDIESFACSPDDVEGLDLWAPDVLDRWSAHVVACTADTVLGLMTHWRSSMVSLPLWAKSVFVFDEVHSYDALMYGALLTFLSVVKSPVLLMTASLSQARRDGLEQALGTTILPIDGDETIESAPRYLLEIANAELARQATLEAVCHGEKVLWVANTVARAQTIFRSLRDVLGSDLVSLYHSRFRYSDRVARQAEVIRRFRTPGSMVVVATQVCEMSLDLSADLLLTELAPFPALVQRLGRLNRRDPVPPRPRRCLITEPENVLPYSRQELDSARVLIAKLVGTPLSQRDLARTMGEMVEEPYRQRATPFLEQTWQTSSAPLRDVSKSLTIVRRGDMPADLATARRADVIRNEIVMTPLGSTPSWSRLKGALVVPDDAINYNLEEGASWAG